MMLLFVYVVLYNAQNIYGFHSKFSCEYSIFFFSLSPFNGFLFQRFLSLCLMVNISLFRRQHQSSTRQFNKYKCVQMKIWHPKWMIPRQAEWNGTKKWKDNSFFFLLNVWSCAESLNIYQSRYWISFNHFYMERKEKEEDKKQK